MLCLNVQLLRRDALHNSSNARFLMDSMFEFAERLNSLALNDAELGLFCAVVVIAAGIISVVARCEMCQLTLFFPIDRSTWPEECGIGGADAIQIAFRIGKCFKSSPSGQSRTLPGIVAQNPRSAHAQYASFGKVAGLQNDGTTTATTTAAKQLQPSSANSASASQSLARLRRRRSQKPNGLRVEQRCRIHLLIRSRRRERLAAVGRRCWKRRSAFVSSSPTSRPVRKRLLFHVQRWRRNGFRPFLVEDCRIAASHPQCRSRKQRRKYQRRLPLF